jgi:hypothetical protein
VSVAHRFPCNALTTRSDVDCSCGALTPQECAALSTREATCVHGRPGGHLCPHCLGINSIMMDSDIQLGTSTPGELDPSCLPGPGETKVFDSVQVSADDLDFQLLNDALKMRCRRCDGTHLDVCNEAPIKNVPGIGTMPVISYACRDCGLDSASKPDASCCLSFAPRDGRTHDRTCRFYKRESA